MHEDEPLSVRRRRLQEEAARAGGRAHASPDARQVAPPHSPSLEHVILGGGEPPRHKEAASEARERCIRALPDPTRGPRECASPPARDLHSGSHWSAPRSLAPTGPATTQLLPDDIPLSRLAEEASSQRARVLGPSVQLQHEDDEPLAARCLRLSPRGGDTLRLGRRLSEDDEPLIFRARRLSGARARRERGAQGRRREGPGARDSGSVSGNHGPAGDAHERGRDGGSACVGACQQGGWADLPSEVLSGALRAAAAERGAVPTMAYAARVCRSWRDVVSSDASLWRKLDLSSGWCRPSDRVFAANCGSGRWSQLEWLSVAGCAQLTDTALSHVARGCPRLAHLDISDGSKKAFTAAGLLSVVHACPIQELVMDHCNSLSAGDLQSKAFLEPWMFGKQCKAARQQVAVGHVLEAASFLGRCTLARVQARCSTLNADVFVCSLVERCLQAPLFSLRVLDLTLTGMGRRDRLEMVPIETLQLACPGLEELRMAAVGDLQGWAMKDWTEASRERHLARSGLAPCFENLRALDLSASRKQSSQGESQWGASYLTDHHLQRIAGASTKLEELGLAGCRQLTPKALTLLPTQTIKFLQMSHCGAAGNDALALAASMWHETLQEIDIGGNRGNVTDIGVRTLSRCAALQRVGLARTGVSESSLWAMVPLTRSRLKEVDVVGCRNLERATKAAGCGSRGLPALVHALEEWAQRQASS